MSTVTSGNYSTLLTRAMEVTDQVDANAIFLDMVKAGVESGLTQEQSENVQRQNLGYFAGYYSHETRARVERLFKCAHPIFGAIAENGAPSSKEAFDIGVKLGKKSKKGKSK